MTTTKTRKKPDEQAPAPAAAAPAQQQQQQPAPQDARQEEAAPQEVMSEADRIAAVLKRPFKLSQLGWKAQAVSKDQTKALAVAFIDARDVMNRLDEAVGIAGWRDSYSVQPDGSVLCRLELCLGGEWVGKEDVGGQSEQPDEGDRAKAAVSDALKRAAVKWGVGRYLYYLDQKWVAYDAQTRKLKEVPTLPHWALPPKDQEPQPTATVIVGGTHVAGPEPTAAPPPPPPPVPLAAPFDRVKALDAYDAKLAALGLSKRTHLTHHVGRACLEAGHGQTPQSWDDAGWAVARAAAVAFERERLCERIDELSLAKAAGAPEILEHLEAKPGASLAQLPNDQLRAAAAWLATLPDARPQTRPQRQAAAKAAG
jgi:hypothetical protein